MPGKIYHALATESRAVLVMLGFRGVSDFARRTGINHMTAGALLGTNQSEWRKRPPIVVQTAEALHSAYMDERATMTKPMRAFVKDWFRRWKKRAMELLYVKTTFRELSEDQPRVKDRERKRKRVRDAVILAMKRFNWE